MICVIGMTNINKIQQTLTSINPGNSGNYKPQQESSSTNIFTIFKISKKEVC